MRSPFRQSVFLVLFMCSACIGAWYYFNSSFLLKTKMALFCRHPPCEFTPQVVMTQMAATCAHPPCDVKPSIPANCNQLVPELGCATVITRTPKEWVTENSACEGDNSFVKTTLRSPAGNTPIYTHTRSADQWVSGAVLAGGIWEEDMVRMMYNLFKEDEELQFLDIGGNIGIYGLTMAKLGRDVIFVEPMLTNVWKICHSVRDGHLSRAVVIHNALSSSRQEFSFGTYRGNIGGTYVKNITNRNEEKVQGALLDDVLEILQLKKVALKIDVETHEAKVLQGGGKFFDVVDVRYVLLEFSSHKGKPSADYIISFLARHGLKPFSPSSGKAFNPADSSSWPRDVFWKKV